MKISIRLKSESGLIKLPPALFESVRSCLRVKLLSYAYYSLKGDKATEKSFEHIVEYMKQHKVEPEQLIMAMQNTTLAINLAGLPKSYYKFLNPSVQNIIVGLDHVKEKDEAYFIPPNKLYICTKAFRKVAFNVSWMADEEELELYFKLLDAVVAHELTHFVQRTLLHPANSIKKYDGNTMEKDNFKYYTSIIEFDPLLKTDIAYFIQKCNKHKPMNRYTLNKYIQYYVNSIDKNSELYPNIYPGFEPSQFFAELKLRKPSAYKKAIGIFTSTVVEQLL